MSDAMLNLLLQATAETLLMILTSALGSALFGIPLGIALHASKPGGILQHATLNRVLGTVVNIGRSIPFIILLVAIIAAVVLTYRGRKDSKKQNISDQVAVKAADRLRVIKMDAVKPQPAVTETSATEAGNGTVQ